jgi:FAD:protein FMN transferase
MSALYHLTWHAMGCEVSVQLETDADDGTILSQLPTQVEAFEACLSRFRPTSELVRFNQRAGDWVEVSETLYQNISAARHAACITDGAFNPLVLPALQATGYDRDFADIGSVDTKPSVATAEWQRIELRRSSGEVRIPERASIDLGGVAKGWTAQRIADDLAPYGACLVNLGGDLVARGAPRGLPGWEVAIANPLGNAPVATLWLRDAALMTSGVDYRRWASTDGAIHHHIIDPHTGASAQTDVMIASVHHADAITAEAYTKAVILAGAARGLLWIQSQWDAAALVIDCAGAVMATPEFLSFVTERLES